MPTIDLGKVVGDPGPQGIQGVKGDDGEKGDPGPNEINSTTTTTLSGILRGNYGSGGKVSVELEESSPSENSTKIVRSGGIYGAIQAKPNPNLLDNWLFTGGGSQLGDEQFPINHNGQTIYTGAGWGIDRWYGRNETSYSLSSGGLALTVASGGGYHAINQSLNNPKSLIGQKVTCSVLVTDYVMTADSTYPRIGLYAAGTAGANSQTVLTKRITGNGITTVTGIVDYDTVSYGVLNFSTFYIASTASSLVGSCKIVAAKLEIGDTQTLARMGNGEWVLNEVPSFPEQLERCLLGIRGESLHSIYRPVGGKVSSSRPQFRFVNDDGTIYALELASNGNLQVRYYDGTSWTTLQQYAPVT